MKSITESIIETTTYIILTLAFLISASAKKIGNRTST
jgi:hypothetical protein